MVCIVQMAQKMIDHGTQTQQGYLRASHITDIYLVEDMEQRYGHDCSASCPHITGDYSYRQI